MTRPNILMFVTDQLRHDHLGYAGDEVCSTPHIDGIAATGAVFTRTYVANPICMPNRASMTTGLMPSVHGTRFNGVPLDPELRTLPGVLSEAGYFTSHVGKLHLQNFGVDVPRLRTDYPVNRSPRRYQETLGTWGPSWEDVRWNNGGRRLDVPRGHYGYDETHLVVGHGDECTGAYRRWLIDEHHVKPEELLGIDNALYVSPEWHQVYKPAVPVELYPTSFIAETVKRTIVQSQGSDQPFFIHCSFPDPHHPFTPPGRYFDMVNPNEVPLPPTFREPSLGSMPHFARARDHLGHESDLLGFVNVWAPTEEQFRVARAAEAGAIALIDDAVGEILRSLRSTGQLENTVVLFTSDHGDMFGDHGLLLKMASHYAGCVRVPLIVAGPGIEAACHDGLTHTTDIFPTVASLAGVHPPTGLHGRSLRNELRGVPSETERESLLVEEDEMFDFVHRSNGDLRMRTLVTAGCRLTLYGSTQVGEMYDLENDPDECVNIYDDPSRRSLKHDMLQRLIDQTMRCEDETRVPSALA